MKEKAMKISAIVPAAGKGMRMQQKGMVTLPKQFLAVSGDYHF